MKVRDLKAEAVPDGRIHLTWTNPAGAGFAGTKVLRRVRRFPEPGDVGSGFEVFRDTTTPAGAAARFVDGPLRGEAVYYYAVLAFDASGPAEAEYVSALAIVPYQSADHLYANLPEIYRVLDRARTGSASGVSMPLRRWVEILGQPFDVLRSYAGAARDFHNLERVDGALVPLLAQWVGQPSDTTLNLERQRNEVRYAPSYYRTAGVAANLRASVNRFANWDARIREFFHSIYCSTDPEQLTMWQVDREGATWKEAENVNLEVAHEGRVAPLAAADGRTWLFYDALRSTIGAPEEVRLFLKIEQQGAGLPALPLTAGAIHKHPAAVQRGDGSVWLFHTTYVPAGEEHIPRITLQVLAAGRAALPAVMTGTGQEPFALADGDGFEISIGVGPGAVTRRLAARVENLGALDALSAAQVAKWLDSELPGVDATATNEGRIVLTTLKTGGTARLTVPASAAGAKLGLAGVAVGADGTAAELGSGSGPFALSDGAQLSVKVDTDSPRTITFHARQFANIAQATLAETVAAINEDVPGLAVAPAGVLRLRSPAASEKSLVSVLVDDSTAAPALGLGALLPPAPAGVAEDEPSACVDGSNGIWLFWASRRSGRWNIRYNRMAGSTWGAPKPLTSGTRPDREPFAVFDPAGGGRLWAFWSRKKAHGLWNVFWRTTTNLNFATLADANWAESENPPAPTDFDNREPAAMVAAGGPELYFASNRADGWNIWSRGVTPAGAGAEAAITSGQATRRAPSPLRTGATTSRLYLRSNESRVYVSSVYPLAETLDSRYAGSTTVDMRNPAKLSVRGNLADMQRYTYDTRPEPPGDARRKQAGLYAREVVGVYLTPDTNDQAFILRQRRLFANALRRFVPLQVRLVFLIDQAYRDDIYTYDLPQAASPVRIGERMIDTILSEVIPAAADFRVDTAQGVRFFRTWVVGEKSGLPDLSTSPPDLGTRLFTGAFNEDKGA